MLQIAGTTVESVKMVKNKLILVLCVTLCVGLAACSRQQSDWEKTRTSNSTDAYELFLKKYPSGEFTAQAQARLKELYEEREWQKARDTDTVDAYQAFLKQYPEGQESEGGAYPRGEFHARRHAVEHAGRRRAGRRA